MVIDKACIQPSIDGGLFADDIYIEIFKRADYPTLLSLKKVCLRFERLLSDQAVWLDICESAGCSIPNKNIRIPIVQQRKQLEESCGTEVYIDYENIRKNDPHRENIVSPLLQSKQLMIDNFQYEFHGTTQIISNVRIEETRSRCILINENCWGRRTLHIDLLREGFQTWVLDFLRPRIVLKEFVRTRDTNNSSTYTIECELLRNEEYQNDELLQEMGRRRNMVTVNKPPYHSFNCIQMEFESYSKGVRWIKISSSGYNNILFGNLSVTVEWPTHFRWLEKSVFKNDQGK